MKILSIELTNFKPFRDVRLPSEGHLPDGLIIIKGPNSTGKSSIFEAVLWCLWGSTAVELTNEELISFSSSFCKVIVEFEVAGRQYKIDRSYDPASRLSVVFYQETVNGWKRIADGSNSVESKLEEIINLGLRQALNTLLVRQGEVALIANATASVLRGLLVDVYNIEILGDMSGHISHLEDDLKTRTGVLEDKYVRPEVIEKQIEDMEERIEEHKGNIESKKDEIAGTEDLLKDVPQPHLLDAIQDMSSKLEREEVQLKSVKKTRDSYLNEAGLLTAEEELVQARLDTLSKNKEDAKSRIEELSEEKSKIEREIGAIRGTETDLQDKIETLQEAKDVTTCPTCSKPLTPEERDDILHEYQDTIKEGKARISKLQTKNKKISEKIQKQQKRLEEIQRALQAIGQIKRHQNDVAEAQAEVDAARNDLEKAIEKLGVKDIQTLLDKHGVKKLGELQRLVETWIAKLGSLKNEIESMNKMIESEQGRISEARKKIEKMDEIGSEIEDLKSLHEHAQYVRRKLVSGFLADYVIQKRLIGIIRGATNPYVRSFTSGQYSGVDLVPTPGRGRGGAGLELQIQDVRDNAVKKTSQLSFGDRTAISLGLRLGISRTMSAIRPLKDSPALSPRVRCVLLDEPLGGLDRERRKSVVQNLVNDQSFRQIFLITHTDVQGWEGVPVVDVSKTGTSSEAKLIQSSDM
jgi:DNA repair exonuclease SbcCD ATPase subunit